MTRSYVRRVGGFNCSHSGEGSRTGVQFFPGLPRLFRTYQVHARTRIVHIERHGEAFLDMLEAGAPWCELTVHARLERMAECYHRLPKVRPPRSRSCMPVPVRERWKDAPKEEGWLTDRALDDANLNAANQIIDVLTAEERLIAWPIAQRKTDRWLGRMLGVHHSAAAARKLAMLEALAMRWNGLGMRPDAEDVRRARRFFHNNI